MTYSICIRFDEDTDRQIVDFVRDRQPVYAWQVKPRLSKILDLTSDQIEERLRDLVDLGALHVDDVGRLTVDQSANEVLSSEYASACAAYPLVCQGGIQ